MLGEMLTGVWLAVDGPSVEDEVESGEWRVSWEPHTSQSSVMSQSGPVTTVRQTDRETERERDQKVSYKHDV